MNDELIQKLLDEGGKLPESSNAEGYRKLYEMLDKQDSFQPSPGFAHRVTAALDSKKSMKVPGLIVPLTAGILLMIIAAVGISLYFNLSIKIDGFTPTLLIMFFLGLVITGVYRIVERKLLRHD